MSSSSRDPADIPVVPYFLVLLIPNDDRDVEPAVFTEHVAFIERMSSERVVLLGGSFEAPIEGATGAYLLRAASKADAEAWASRDPLMKNGVCHPRVVTWNLVGITLGAIDPALTG